LAKDKTFFLTSFLLYCCSFFVPLLVLFFTYCQLGIGPAGEKTILICDLSGQYVDFYSTYQQILSERKSLLYSWQAGLGLNFLGLFSYYLASPFSLLILLADQESLPESLLLITLLKIGCCGLSFAIAAKKMFKLSNGLIFIGSLLYALCSYNIAYSFNLMWLDGVIILPLLILGVEKILRERNCLLYLFSLIYILLANFYIGYMVALFSFLYFLVSSFSAYAWPQIKLFLPKLLLLAGSALLAAGCVAIILIPTFFALQNGQGGPSLSLWKWTINFDLLDLLSKSPLGAYDTLKYQGLPNIYCGLLPLILSSLYFLNGSISFKERLGFAALTGFIIMSFALGALNLAWHGFDSPDWFPFRYSFVLSFLLLFLAAKGISQLDRLPTGTIVKTGALWALVMLILQKMDYPYLRNRALIIGAFLFILYSLLLAGLAGSKKDKIRKAIVALLIVLALAESTLNCRYLIKGLDQEFAYVSKEKYQQVLPGIKAVINEIHSQDQTFYRLDRIGGRTYNDPMNLNYRGLTHFSSLAYADLNKTLRQLGFLCTAGYKSINFAGSTPLTESLLAIKYVISAEQKGLGYTKIADGPVYDGYRNIYALPIAFLTDESLLSWDSTKDNNPFRLQNSFFNLAQGNKEKIDYFRPLEVIGIKLTNATMTTEPANGFTREIYSKKDPDLKGEVEYTLLNPESQQVYACFNTINDDGCRIFVDGQEIKGYLPLYNKRIIDLGFHPENKEIKVKITFSSSGFSLKQKYFYGLSEANLAQALTPLHLEKIEDLAVTDTSVQGKVSVKDKKLLFTSVPYDPGWRVFVDGRETVPSVIDNVFIGIRLEEGIHHIALHFRPKGFYAGAVLSMLSFLLVILLIGRRLRR